MTKLVVPAFANDPECSPLYSSTALLQRSLGLTVAPLAGLIWSVGRGEKSHLVVVCNGLAGRGEVVVCDVLQLASVVVVVCMTAQHNRVRVSSGCRASHNLDREDIHTGLHDISSQIFRAH